MEEDKFQFGTDFQQSLLQYTVTDKNGYRALSLYEDTYFLLLEHQIIARALKSFFKKKKRIPQSKVLLKEQLRQLFMGKDFINSLSAEDKSSVIRIVNKIYSSPVKDGDEILLNTIKFAQYIKLKNTIENVNLTDFTQYDPFSVEVRKAISIGNEFTEKAGVFLIRGIRDRQFTRKFSDSIIPTPFHGINRLANGGGYPRGTVIVLIGPQKEFKTGMLVNITRAYLKRRKKILYIDFENGEDALALRLEQSIMNMPLESIASGEHDKKILKQFRKYQRLGGEVHVKRMPSYTTTCNDIQNVIDKDYREFGIRYDALVCDYAALGCALSGTKDETQRISDFYVDLKNLANHNQFETTWTANHVIRAASDTRFKTKFQSTDTAKCIDIVRHVDVAFGFNRSELDQSIGTARLEIMDQRNGVSEGFALFKVDYKNQRADEVSKSDLKDYFEALKQVKVISLKKVKSDMD